MPGTNRETRRPQAGPVHASRSSRCTAAALAALAALFTLPALGAGLDDFGYDSLGQLLRHRDPAGAVTDYVYDAAGNLLAVLRLDADQAAQAPRLATLSPSRLRIGERQTMTLTGERLASGTLAAAHPGLQMSRLRQGATQLQFELQVSAGVPTGPQPLRFANARGQAEITLHVSPPLPLLSVEPSPLALPPDDRVRAVTVRLSGADDVPHEISLSSSDPQRLAVQPALLTVAPGQTSALVQLRPRQAGFAELRLHSAHLGSVVVPVFLTQDFRGANTSHAAPVGVRVGEPTPSAAAAQPLHLGGLAVGVAVGGGVLTSVSPGAVAAGASERFSAQGVGLPAGLRVEVEPPQGLGVTLEGLTPQEARWRIDADANAAPGIRRIVVRDAQGKPLTLADAALGQLRVTTGQPRLDSIEPLFAVPGSTVSVRVRGRHLQHARLSLEPAADLRVDAQPQVSADGTELSAGVQVSALAALGPRTLRVHTPSGDSEPSAHGADQLTLVRSIEHGVSPIVAAPVGVLRGAASDAAAAPGTVASASVGLAVGPAARALAPAVGIRGTRVAVTVDGQGLDAVTSAALLPPDDLVLEGLRIAADGRQLAAAITIGAEAPLGPRRLVLRTAKGDLNFALPSGDQFLVAAPVPQLDAVTPQVLALGQSVQLTVRGQRLAAVTGASFLPGGDVLAVGPFESQADGSALTFQARVAPDAATGARTLVLHTAGGDSSAVPTPGNTLHIAREHGPVRDAIAAPPVGVSVASAAAAQPQPQSVHAPAVGVLRAAPAVDGGESRQAWSTAVGVVVGTVIERLSPRSPQGLARGQGAPFTLYGWGLGSVSDMAVVGAPGLSLGPLEVAADGRSARIPVQASDTAPSADYALRASSGAPGSRARVPSVDEAALLLSVGGAVEAIDSVGPIVLEQGKAATLVVRGLGLRDVIEVLAEPPEGLRLGGFGAVPTWSTDELGEKLSLPLQVAPTAATSPRVIRLRTPGALTGAESLPGNTVQVVAPQ